MRPLDELIGEKGLLNFFSQTIVRPFYPKNLKSVIGISRNLNFFGCSEKKITVGATDFSYENCLKSAIGEFIERFLGSRIDYNELIYGSYNSLKNNYECLHPSELSLFADWQYEINNFFYERFLTDSETYWIKGVEFFENKDILIPAFMVYWSTIVHPKNKVFLNNTTSGLGAGSSLINAIKSGFFETLERDAFCKFWYNQKNEDFIIYDANTILNSYPNNSEILSLYKNPKVRFKIFDLGKICPVECIVVFMVFSYKGQELYSVGASAKLSKEEAIIKATFEAYQVSSLAKNFSKANKEPSPNLIDYLKSLNSFESQYNFYNQFPKYRNQSPILREVFKSKSGLSQIIYHQNKMKFFTKEELKKNMDFDKFYFIDITDKSSIGGLPYHVARVIIPNKLMISGNFNYPFLSNNELNSKDNLFVDLPNCFP